MDSVSTPLAQALVAEAIARIEARRDTLDGLADKGMAMIERLVADEVVEISGRKPFADPARAFAVISRAVRLCLALASRLDAELIALLRGGPIPDLAILRPEAEPAPKPLATSGGVDGEPTAAFRASKIRSMAADEPGDIETGERLRTQTRECLLEYEDHDAFLHRPWSVVVRTLRADLGVEPDGEGRESPESLISNADVGPSGRRSGGCEPPEIATRTPLPGARSPPD